MKRRLVLRIACWLNGKRDSPIVAMPQASVPASVASVLWACGLKCRGRIEDFGLCCDYERSAQGYSLCLK
jgi:hypothetical protein